MIVPAGPFDCVVVSGTFCCLSVHTSIVRPSVAMAKIPWATASKMKFHFEKFLGEREDTEQAEWDKAHPDLKDHPESVYRWMRKRHQIEERERRMERRHTSAHPFHDGTNGHDGAKELWISTTP